MIEKKYTTYKLAELILENGLAYFKVQNDYNMHLTHVLYRAYGFELDDLLNQEDFRFLSDLIATYKTMRTPTSNMIESSLAYSKFEILGEISDAYYEQKQAICKILNLIIVHHIGKEKAALVFKESALLEFGLNKDLEPDFDKLLDEY